MGNRLETLTEERQSKVAHTKRVEAQRDTLTGDRDVAVAHVLQIIELFHCQDRVRQNMTLDASVRSLLFCVQPVWFWSD